jgi:hypothetical protein
MTRYPLLSAVVAFSIFTSSSAFAADRNKYQYNLFNPTPKDEMREMSTDRPDKTESPYTVDAGHYQIESDLVAYTYDKETEDGVETEVNSVSTLPVNIKVGLTNFSDLQLVVDTYSYTKVKTNGEERKVSGFGDLTARFKVNFWGNDNGDTAFAAMPFLKFPTNHEEVGNNAVEGGLIFPLGIALTEEVGLGLMAEFDFNRNDEDNGYHTNYIGSATVGYPITGDLGGYLEVFTDFSDEEDAEELVTGDVGFTYGLNEDVQVDWGVNIGLSDAADDIAGFLGLSIRI